MSDPVVAIACSDIHLTLTPPAARAKEPNWLEAMGRSIAELNHLVKVYEAPILCAGDVFDTWRVPNELVNWAIQRLPQMISIPGQHDLPYHQVDDIKKSAYYTLELSDVIQHADAWLGGGVQRLAVFPTLWEQKIVPPIKQDYKVKLNILLCHRYIWQKGCSYPGAPEENHVSNFICDLNKYDVAIFGDNHKGFITKCGNCTVINCGCLFRRKSDEIGYKPMVGLIHESGEIEPYYMDTSKDVIEATEQVKKEETDMELASFLKELSILRNSKLDFKDAVHRTMNSQKISLETRKILLLAMEH